MVSVSAVITSLHTSKSFDSWSARVCFALAIELVKRYTLLFSVLGNDGLPELPLKLVFQEHWTGKRFISPPIIKLATKSLLV